MTSLQSSVCRGVAWRNVQRAVALALIALAASLALGASGTSRAAAAPTTRLYAQKPCTAVYAAPDTKSRLLTQLLGGADVSSVGQLDSGGAHWQHVRIWSGLEGYILAGQLGTGFPSDASEGSCEFPGVPDPQDDLLPASRGPWPVSLTGKLSAPATLYARADGRSLPVDALPVGATVAITAWASDGAGGPWYQVSAAGRAGWLWSGNVRLDMPNPARHTVGGAPIWSPVAGKGMWFVNYLPHHSDVTALMQAAKLAGITHLYAEVAITQYGFYGRNSLDRLLPAAHAAGISVIAWVYPNLNDIAADVRMTLAVADYVTPSGQRADGLATDVEEVDNSASVYTYGQLVRGLVGPDTLLVAAVYHPYAQIYYPYAAIAASWNVLAPMDYWHSRRHHAYSSANVATFVGSSLMTIRAAMGALDTDATLPLEELGQTYDMYTGDGTGAADAPTAEEMTSDMRTAQQAGCIGISFFEWQTTTQDEWQAISTYRW